MVFLDQNCIVQTQAMIAAAAALDGVFLCQTQAGKCFSGINDLRPGVGNGVSILPCLGRYARKQLQKCQCLTLACGQGPRRAFNFAQKLVGNDPVAVGGCPDDRNSGVESGEAVFKPCSATQHSVFAGDNRGASDGIVSNQLSREIAATDVRGQGDSNIALDFSSEQGSLGK